MKEASFTVTFTVVALFTILPQTHCFFNRSPDNRFDTSSLRTSTVIKISPSEEKIAVGYKGGYLGLYTLSGDQILFTRPHSTDIIGIEWFESSRGFMTLETEGSIIRWSEYGVQLHSWLLNGTALGMSYTLSNEDNYIAINFGSHVIEYNAVAGTLTRTYDPNNTNSTITAIQYSDDRQYLYMTFQDASFRIYDCLTDSYIIQWYLPSWGVVRQLDLMNDGSTVIALTDRTRVLTFDTLGNDQFIDSFISANAFSQCRYSNLFAMAEAYYSDVGIYDNQQGQFQQYISSLDSSAPAIHCGGSYLVSIDSEGVVYVNSTQGLPTWAVITIVFVVVVFVATVAIVIGLRVSKGRKMKRLARYNQGMERYHQNINTSINPNGPYFNNQSQQNGINQYGVHGQQNYQNQYYPQQHSYRPPQQQNVIISSEREDFRREAAGNNTGAINRTITSEDEIIVRSNEQESSDRAVYGYQPAANQRYHNQNVPTSAQNPYQVHVNTNYNRNLF